MPNRILREGILTSERVNALNWEAEVFYRRLMSVVDDFGRFTAHPSLLRAALYPLKLDTVRDANMERLLAIVEQASLVRVYEVAGKRFLEMLDFRQQVRAKESKYPPPPSDESHVHSTCIADEAHVQANAHLDGGGGEDVSVDDIPTTHSTREDELSTDGEQFSMRLDWKPSAHFAELARMAGVLVPGDDTPLGEFIAYWIGQPKRRRTQHEWDHAYLKNLKAEKARKDAGIGIPTRKGAPPPPSSEWFMTASGIEAKAADHGLTQQRDETFPSFKARVYEAAGVTDEMVRRAKIDRGEQV